MIYCKIYFNLPNIQNYYVLYDFVINSKPASRYASDMNAKDAKDEMPSGNAYAGASYPDADDS